ncbi:MAG TPA: GNAT family N-acetyltransferase [Anaerolineales bacterium]|nr:GNAT family N-acetyltransferase [Anaerolineales bacterium]
MNIRRAAPGDSLVLSNLCMDVQQRLHAAHHADIFKIPQQENFAVSFFDEMLADPMTSIFIAETDGRSLGYVLCKLIERPESPFTFAMRYLLVDQISVRLVEQGKGIGQALLDQAEVLAKELNVSRIQLDSWGFNTQAHTFFEKMGFEKFNHRFWRNL